MKKLTLALALLISATSWADDRVVAEYGKQYTHAFEMYDAAGLVDINESDGGSELQYRCLTVAETVSSTTDLADDFTDQGKFYTFQVSAAEMECRIVIIEVGAALDHTVFIETCGTPNAEHVNCSGPLPYISAGTSAVADNTTTVTELTDDNWADDDLNGKMLCAVEDQATGNPRECKIITDYNGTSEDATHEAFLVAIPNGGEYIVYPDERVIVNNAGGLVEANVIQWEGADVTDTYDSQLATGIAALATETNVNDNETKLDIIDTVVDANSTVLVAGVPLADDSIDTDSWNINALPLFLAAATADSGTTSTFVDATLNQSDNDYWKGVEVVFTSGNILSQRRCVTGFTAATDTIAFAPDTTQAVTTNSYVFLATGACDTVVNTINTGVITADAIAANAIGASEIAASAIGSSELATDAILAAHIGTGAIGADEIATNAIGALEIASSAIGASEIATDAIGNPEIAADAIGASEMAANAIGASELATDAIGNLEIAADAIGASEMAANAIGASEIATNAIGDAEVAVDAFDDLGMILVHSTIATLTTQTDFTITASSPDNNAYDRLVIVVKDSSDATQRATSIIRVYTGGSKRVELRFDPGVFTMAVGDDVYILAP